MTEQMHVFHEHPLSVSSSSGWPSCEMCKIADGEVYRCKKCRFRIHKDCADRYFSETFTCSHILKICNSNAGDSCFLCLRDTLWLRYCRVARCRICNITIDMDCAINPLPPTIFQPKHHKHSLAILLRLVTFTCNACGVKGDRSPYVCLECNLMVHKDCTDLPRVISINRHDHRISHTFHLGQGEGDWNCGVCRQMIDWVYGAFKCSRCPSYAVHSKCATTRKEVWDGIELEDVPEEEEEEIEDPFKVLNDLDIIHFSHEQHILRLDENYVTENDDRRCWGCFFPLNDDPCYKCVECDFSLHKTCANLPRKKRHLLHNHKLTLQVDDDDEDSIFICTACRRPSSKGFRYICSQKCETNRISYDTRCSSVSEPFHHDLHSHPLYFTLESFKQCHACLQDIEDNPLCCIECEYALCMVCATLPRKVKQRCDDHFLSLSQGAGNSCGDLWCDICETKTDPSVCYYTCDECGLSLHIDCVLGDYFRYMKVGFMYPGMEIVANNSVTRPFCSVCETHCKFPFIVRVTKEDSVRDFSSADCSLSTI